MIAPASLSSGMIQINVFTDLFFASKIVGAAAALSLARFNSFIGTEDTFF